MRSISKSARARSTSASNIPTSTSSRRATITAGGSSTRTAIPMGERDMSFSNFTIETDSDGIALVTWDSPDRSMNVIDAKVMDELSAIIDQTTADAAVKGVVITSGKDAFCAGADLTMLENL